VNLWIADSNCARLVSYSAIANVDVVIACGQINPCARAQGDVSAAGGVAVERKGTNRRVVSADGIVLKGTSSIGRVVVARRVKQERSIASSCIVAAGSVLKERERSSSRVLSTSAVEQKRSRARGCIFARCVHKQRCSADAGVEPTVSEAQERIQPKSGVVCAGGQTRKGCLPFCCIPAGIAPIWGRVDCLRQRRKCAKRKEAKVKEDCAECVFHKLNTARDSLLFQRIEKEIFVFLYPARQVWIDANRSNGKI
jgi:hypothetical protein